MPAGQIEVVCCTHTGLPHAQDHREDERRYLVANNGSAGLPNFIDRHDGVITRLSVDPGPPTDSLYGLDLDGLRFDVLPVGYDRARWIADFERTWPPGTPSHRGYHRRLGQGTWLTVHHAARGNTAARSASDFS